MPPFWIWRIRVGVQHLVPLANSALFHVFVKMFYNIGNSIKLYQGNVSLFMVLYRLGLNLSLEYINASLLSVTVTATCFDEIKEQ